MRLIDADNLVKVLDEELEDRVKGETIYTNALKSIFLVGFAKQVINDAPTVDAEPVRHGHWKEHKDYPGLAYLCSGCGYFTTDRSYYCPYCGAKNEVEE